MKNDTCIICGEKFKPRENKLYCSDKCKQIAYQKRIDEKNVDVINNDVTVKEVVNKKVIVFYMSEYEEVISKLPETMKKELKFEKYCFLRKNYSGKPVVEDIVKYLMLLKEEIENDYFCYKEIEDNFIYDQFHEFMKDFYNHEKYTTKNSRDKLE